MLATLTNVKQAPGMLPTDDYYNKIQTFTWNEFIYTKIYIQICIAVKLELSLSSIKK